MSKPPSTSNEASQTGTSQAAASTKPAPTASGTAEGNSTSPAFQPPSPGLKAANTLMIAIPIALGTVFFFVILLFLWRRFHKRSFDKCMSYCPGFATFHRWSETRSKNRETRKLRGTYTGDKDGLTRSLHSRQFWKQQEEAGKEKEKQSFETTGSRWVANRNSRMYPLGRNTGHNMPSIPSETALASPTKRRGLYGPFTKAETESLESWEEKWFNLGSEDDLPEPGAGNAIPPTRGAPRHEREEEAYAPDFEAKRGQGQSYTKLL